ncbi:MAG: class I fructose-bisphosphate aldolase [Alphaproteobacteria bacterium]|nr:MAG: class I fructose-bisphosphate aldolase [Alphaproteobacteria bacterium]
MSQAIRTILGKYEGENPGCKAKLYTMMNHGKLAGTGRMVIYPVDQGFEHGPGRSFGMNPSAYDPHFHYKLAIDSGVSAFAAPLGLLEAGADSFAGSVPLILKINSGNTLTKPYGGSDQAVTSAVADALRLGCVGVGFTIYPGSDVTYDMFEEVRDIIADAKAAGLAVIVWSYTRGNMSKEGETAIDVVSYGAHMACLLGAHVVKVKLPTAHLEKTEAKYVYQDQKIAIDTLADRVGHVVDSCFAGRRMVIFSGGAKADDAAVLADARAIRQGGGNGSIIGRNCFQRPYKEAMTLLDQIIQVYT